MHPLEALEEWRERAAICEYDGGLSRDEAEALATARVTGRATPAKAAEAPVIGAEQAARMRQLCLLGGHA